MKTNDLRFTANRVAPNGEQWEIKIRLNDECKNGHQDFSITGTAWEKGKPKADRYMLHGGACGDEICKLWPEFEIFNRLHLCDCKGRPMYASENGLYHFTNTSFGAGRDYLRLTNEEAIEIFKYVEEKEAFQYFLEKTGVVGRWEGEALEAIRLLESMTGDEFVNDSKRYQYTPLSEEEYAKCEQMDANGKFSIEKIHERKQQKIDDDNKKRAVDEIKKCKQLAEFAEAKTKAVKAIVAAGLPLCNCKFYDHSKSCKFNWKSYDTLITD
jgi:hypothetical protein